MLVNLVKVRIKPEQRQRFLQAIEHDALASERDEPGCLRFNVIRDTQDENVYFFYEVYKDQAAIEAHRGMPHYAVWSEASAVALDGPVERAEWKLPPVVGLPRPEYGHTCRHWSSRPKSRSRTSPASTHRLKAS